MSDHNTRALLERCYTKWMEDADPAECGELVNAIRSELAKPQADPVAASGEDLEIYREMANNYFKSTTPQHDAPETIALKAERDALLTALRVIAFMQHDIGSPPIISVEEVMRRKARSAIAKAEGGATIRKGGAV